MEIDDLQTLADQINMINEIENEAMLENDEVNHADKEEDSMNGKNDEEEEEEEEDDDEPEQNMLDGLRREERSQEFKEPSDELNQNIEANEGSQCRE